MNQKIVLKFMPHKYYNKKREFGLRTKTIYTIWKNFVIDSRVEIFNIMPHEYYNIRREFGLKTKAIYTILKKAVLILRTLS